MTNYVDLDMQALIDLLVKHTNDYTNMLLFSAFSVDDFAQCKTTLAELHQAIVFKSEQEGHTMKNIIPDFPDYI